MASITSSVASTSCSTISSIKTKADIFQDLPFIDRDTRLTVIELKKSDKQIANELVYRFCKILTRLPKGSLDKLAGPSDTAIQDMRKVLILDMIGAINPVRLATVLKRDDRRLRLIGISRGCKINSTYVTLNTYLTRYSNMNNSSLKLLVVYHDEFFITKTLTLLMSFLRATKCQVIFIVPKMDRQECDVLNLTSSYQTLKCDFTTSRRNIKPAPPGQDSDSYQNYLNQVFFHRSPPNKVLPERIEGELRELGLYLHKTMPAQVPIGLGPPLAKRVKSNSIEEIATS